MFKIDIPEIPNYVAKELEYWKNRHESLYDTLGLVLEVHNSYPTEKEEKVIKWVEDNQDTFALAYLFGYTVEENKLYYIQFVEGDEETYLNVNVYPNRDNFLGDKKQDGQHKTKFTIQEIEELGINYELYGVPVEEDKG